MLNLSINNFSDEDKDNFEKLANYLPDEFQLVLVHNNFDAKTKDRLRKKLKKNI